MNTKTSGSNHASMTGEEDTEQNNNAAVHEVTSAQAFSRAAPLFESDEEVNPLALWTRRRSLAKLDAAFKAGDRVLEIGCGTGIEATHLARRGVNVVATDAAPGMIATISAKVAPGGSAYGLPGKIEPLLVPAHHLGELLETYGPGSFDGAYSSMGPLNCEPSLEPVANALAQLVKPGGRLVFGILNRYCLWETAWYLRARQPKLAFRRWGGRAEATSRPAWQEEKFTCYYWNRGEIERVFKPQFRVTRREGLPWFLPPLYLDGLIRRAPRFFSRAAKIDRRFAAVWPAYDIGDHLWIQFERQPV
ncbi:MAG: methyltransferase domain-containing protein [Chloroflexota bacterium]